MSDDDNPRAHRNSGKKASRAENAAALLQDIEQQSLLGQVYIPDFLGDGIFRRNEDLFGKLDGVEPRSFAEEKGAAKIRYPPVYKFIHESETSFTVRITSHSKSVTTDKSAAASLGLGLAGSGSDVHVDFAVEKSQHEGVEQTGSALRCLLHVQQSRIEVNEQQLKENVKKLSAIEFNDVDGARKFIQEHGLLYCAEEVWGGYAEEKFFFSTESVTSVRASTSKITQRVSGPQAIKNFVSVGGEISSTHAKSVNHDRNQQMVSSKRLVCGGKPSLIELDATERSQDDQIASFGNWHQSVLHGVAPVVLKQKWRPIYELFSDAAPQKKLLKEVHHEYKADQDNRIPVLQRRVRALGEDLVTHDRNCRILFAGPVGSGKSTLCDLALGAMDFSDQQTTPMFQKHIQHKPNGEDDGGVEHETTKTKRLSLYEPTTGVSVLDFCGVRPVTSSDHQTDLDYLKYCLQGRVQPEKEVGKGFFGRLKRITDKPDPEIVPDAVVLVVNASNDESAVMNKIFETVKAELARRDERNCPPLSIFLAVTHMDKVVPSESLEDIRELNSIDLQNLDRSVKHLRKKHKDKSIPISLEWVQNITQRIADHQSREVQSVCRFTFFPDKSRQEHFKKAMLAPAAILILRLLRDVLVAYSSDRRRAMI